MTAPWDGTGLPPSAIDRLERARTATLATSLLSVPSAAGLHAAGLEPVGEVMGCAVFRFGWQQAGYCGMTSQVLRANPSYEQALRDAWGAAVFRLTEEAQSLGAAGVVGAARTVTRLDNVTQEFVMLGTAVRFTGIDKPFERPFIAEQSGTDVAKLMLAGWLPMTPILGLAVLLRHDDYRTRWNSGLFAPNVEIPGYTDLVSQARAVARRDLELQAGRWRGAEGLLMTSQQLRIHQREPTENHKDHIAEQTFFGTAISRLPARLRPKIDGGLSITTVATDRRSGATRTDPLRPQPIIAVR
ncbi:MAG: heavy metal-binding domain-containing protein [Actinomycetota bacterium]|nr:heavy metal-binding domain-containing protein [Actinomycetota bacterium]